MSEVVLKAQGLSKRYGDLLAVDDLSIEVQRGEVFGFLGPNGAGKTTSINMICGLLEPDSGTVSIDGESIIRRDEALRTRLGVCPQDIVVWQRLTCREQLEFMGEMYALPRQTAIARSRQLLADLDLIEKQDVQARALSGGMQRRLNLALALVHDPQIVILDEPGAGLDPQSRVNVRRYIHALARSKTIILTTHNMDEAERLADRVAIIDRGRLLELDTPAALKRRVGEGDVVEIEITAQIGAAHKSAVEKALKPIVDAVHLDIENRRVTVRALNAVGKLAAIIEILEQQNLPVGEMRLRENTLEDVFIQLTGRSLRS
jgi:ABC-2 type transport system ATP-binding protein